MAMKRANGEGSIRKRADGRWEGRYTAGYHPETGKRIIKNVLGKTQAECKAKLKKAIEESKALDISRANEYTVATWLRTWFELYAKPHIRPSTMNYYHRNIEQHVAPAIGDIPLNKLTTRDLQKLYNDLQSNGRLRKVQKKKGFIENLVVFYLENSGHKITLYTKRWFALANHFFLCYNIFRYFSIFGGFLLTLNQYLLLVQRFGIKS